MFDIDSRQKMAWRGMLIRSMGRHHSTFMETSKRALPSIAPMRLRGKRSNELLDRAPVRLGETAARRSFFLLDEDREMTFRALPLLHFSDLTARTGDVRSGEQSGLPSCALRLLSLTHMQHQPHGASRRWVTSPSHLSQSVWQCAGAAASVIRARAGATGCPAASRLAQAARLSSDLSRIAPAVFQDCRNATAADFFISVRY
jgi:hypothetical protein